jgi:DNA-binding NarL/FixJ family response regulator
VTIRVLAVDDHPVVAQGVLALATQLDPEIEPVGTCKRADEISAKLSELTSPPDVILMDLHLEDGSAPAETIARLAQAGHHVVVLTSEMRPVPIRSAIRAGAIGLCLKSDEPDLIVHVLRSAAAGAFSVSSDLAFVLMTDAELTAKLAPREIEALQLLADGVPRKSVGERMDPPVAMSTVVTYLNRACARYREMGVDVQSPRDAVRAAIQDGYFDSPEI